MKNLVKNFASLGFAPHDRGALARARRFAAVFAVVTVCLSATGCSMMGSVSGLWPFGGSDGPVTRESFDSPEDLDKAIADAQAQATLAPQEPYWAYHLGELHLAAENYGEAASSLQAAMALDPAYAPAAGLLSKMYYDAGSYEAGAVLLEDFIARNPGAPDELRAALALHLEALGDVDAAEAVLAECSTNTRDIRTTRTFVSLRGADLAGAYDAAKRAVDDNSKSAVNQNNYGIALLGQGRPQEARDAFMKALDIDDKLAGAMYNMAIVETFYFLNEVAGREWFDKYKQLSNEDPDDLASVFGTAPTAGMSAEASE